MLPDNSGCVGTGQFQTPEDRLAGAGRRTTLRCRVPEEAARPPDRARQHRRSGRADARQRRHLRGRRHDRRPAHHDGSGGHGKKAARQIDAWLRGGVYGNRRSTRWSRSQLLNLTVFLDADRREHAELPVSKRTGFDEIVSGLSRARSALRGHALSLLRQLLRVRQLLRGLSGTSDYQVGKGRFYRVELDLLHGMRGVLRAVPVPCHRHGAGTRVRAPGRRPRSRENARTVHGRA